MSASKTTVPKFASFRPKPSQPVPSASDETRDRKGIITREIPQDTGDDRKRRHRRHRSRSGERSHGPIVKHPPSPPKAQTSDLFIIDRKGDVKNLVYRSIHRYSIPPYYRTGAGSVLGASIDTKIDRDFGDEKGIVLSSRRNLKSNSREKYIFSKVERQRPRLLKIRPELLVEPATDLEVDFIPLTTGRGRKRDRDDHDDSTGSDQEAMHYRSIHGKAKANDQPADDTFQYATENESSDSDQGQSFRLDSMVRSEAIKLSRKVEQFPHDVDAWIALIEHQDRLLRDGHDRRRITNAEMRSTADIKIHMYEKALEKCQSLPDRERLLLGLMTEGSKIWEIKVQSDKWEKISMENIGSLVLWQSYLDFRQTTFSKFRYEEVRDIFIKRLDLLLAAIRSARTNKDSLYKQLLLVLLRFTIYIRESGYSELAIAIWQGLLEFNFFAPPRHFSHEEKIALFKEFWESEVPRIGEENALGWSYFLTNEGSSDPPDVLTDEVHDSVDQRNVFKSWAKAERLRSDASHVPARTMDEVTEDDPFRVIMVSDIEEFMISIPSDSESLRLSLLNAYLSFCNQPLMKLIDLEAIEHWPYDGLTSDNILDCGSELIKKQYSMTEGSFEEGEDIEISSVFNTPVSQFVGSPESMFNASWFKAPKSWQECYAMNGGPISYQWLRATLKQLTVANINQHLAEYYLAFEWRNEPKTIKKISKILLKHYPSNLRLYNAYGMIEWSRANKEFASGVFSTALNMSKSLPEADRRDSIYLWKSWTWASIEDLENDTALRRIISMVDGNPGDEVTIGPIAMLKAKQYLSANRDHLLTSGDISHAIIYAEYLALLEYLSSRSHVETQSSSQGDITSALSVFAGFSQVLQTCKFASSSHELFLQSAARLLYHHARTGPFRPALLREHLSNFLNLFPRNTIFLSLYTFNESRLRIDNRVRNMLLSTVLTPENDTLTSRLFAIHYEIGHGTIHSARAAFEHALSSPTSRSSPGLWKLYILYCLQTPQFHLQIKDMWYRALRACPWVKELYILGFETMGDLVEFGELKGTWRVMGEKDLRVHVDLEEVFEKIGDVDERERTNVRRLL